MPSNIKPSAPSRSVTDVGRGDYIKVGGRLEKITSNSAAGAEHTPRSWSVTTESGRSYGMRDIQRYAKADDVE